MGALLVNRARIEERKAELEAERASGLARMQDIRNAEAELAATMHRISGAIQVLDELLQEQPQDVPE